MENITDNNLNDNHTQKSMTLLTDVRIRRTYVEE